MLEMNDFVSGGWLYYRGKCMLQGMGCVAELCCRWCVVLPELVMLQVIGI